MKEDDAIITLSSIDGKAMVDDADDDSKGLLMNQRTYLVSLALSSLLSHLNFAMRIRLQQQMRLFMLLKRYLM